MYQRYVLGGGGGGGGWNARSIKLSTSGSIVGTRSTRSTEPTLRHSHYDVFRVDVVYPGACPGGGAKEALPPSSKCECYTYRKLYKVIIQISIIHRQSVMINNFL